MIKFHWNICKDVFKIFRKIFTAEISLTIYFEINSQYISKQKIKFHCEISLQRYSKHKFHCKISLQRYLLKYSSWIFQVKFKFYYFEIYFEKYCVWNFAQKYFSNIFSKHLRKYILQWNLYFEYLCKQIGKYFSSEIYVLNIFVNIFVKIFSSEIYLSILFWISLQRYCKWIYNANLRFWYNMI